MPSLDFPQWKAKGFHWGKTRRRPTPISSGLMYLRPADGSDGPILITALFEAFNWAGNDAFSREEILGIPEIIHYISGWKRESDFGSIAHNDQGQPVGAAWGRLFSSEDRGYGFVAGILSAQPRRGRPEPRCPALPAGRLPESRQVRRLGHDAPATGLS